MDLYKTKKIPDNYFEIRDFEYSQFIYDLVYISEIASLAVRKKITKYRLKSLSRAAYSIDGYSTQTSDWLNGNIEDNELDYVPSLRIKKYLYTIKNTGRLNELDQIMGRHMDGCLRLRSIPRVRKKQIARVYGGLKNNSDVFIEIASTCNTTPKIIERIFTGQQFGKFQKAHIYPPLFRFMKSIEVLYSYNLRWKILGIKEKISTVENVFRVAINSDKLNLNKEGVLNIIQQNPLFKLIENKGNEYKIQHSTGWNFILSETSKSGASHLNKLILRYDPLINFIPQAIKSDLHTHTTWSDGLTPIDKLAEYSLANGLDYILISDHSRSSKIQGGLTPSRWLKQRRALSKSKFKKYILHGLEVDILPNGDLDFPTGILSGMDLVVGSVHSGWGGDFLQNTNRIIKALESGYIDILGHPTATITGKPGVPNYYRPPVNADWDKIFSLCAEWNVALEINCFPSRLDLSYENVEKALKKGCWISLGSDAHSKRHLDLIKFGIEIINEYDDIKILNSLSLNDIKLWLIRARKIRKSLPKSNNQEIQLELFDQVSPPPHVQPIVASACTDSVVLPSGSDVVGLDLTAGANKKTGVAYLSGNIVQTTSILLDNDIIEYIKLKSPKFVSIDSPLGLPGGTKKIIPKAGIVRKAERDLSSVGIPAYPALIDSMKGLTLRGIKLRNTLESLPEPPIVIESYPGAAQDVLGIPRKQNGLDYLKHGLMQIGLTGPGLQSSSHDEIDAITCCIVGRFFESGDYEPMGIASEAQLIVPKTTLFNTPILPIISLSGKPGTGKSVIARYLVLFYGFEWIKTHELLINLINDDFDSIASKRLNINPSKLVTETKFHQFQRIILNEYKQVPLKNLIYDRIESSKAPVVVDSLCLIDEIVNIDSRIKNHFNWYVSCPDIMISSINATQANTKSKSDLSIKRISFLKARADFTIENNGTLENLHWAIDDVLFNKMIKIDRTF